MQRYDPQRDEAARRLAGRPVAGEDEMGRAKPLPRLGWRDILAMIIAAYQVLLPIMLIMFGTLVFAFLLFRWVFN